MRIIQISFLVVLFSLVSRAQTNSALKLSKSGYFDMPGLNVIVFQDFYPEGHQGGVTILQHGIRVASNGDLRLEPTPGQWSPIPALKKREVDSANNLIKVSLAFPDSSRDKKGFNPIDYPDLNFNYTVNVKPEGKSVRVTVDLDRPLPASWEKKVGFNLELYPVDLFGKSWQIDNTSGLFPRQPNGPVVYDENKEIQHVPYASGYKLSIAPESEKQRIIIESKDMPLSLYDGRSIHNNGWFIVRSLVKPGVTKSAVEWVISPNIIDSWRYEPVIQISQVGYHPDQEKIAVIETDPLESVRSKAILYKIGPDGSTEKIFESAPVLWGKFLRYNYYHFDFSSVSGEGLYFIQLGSSQTLPFKISADVYDRNVWQPVLEYFLPVQMCHMRVNEKYRVWHGVCHMDDALMAPVDHIHFDGYAQGPSTLTKYKPFDQVPGLNTGGWHDAGDDDLRVESQAGEIYILSLINEEFKTLHDNTFIDQHSKLVEIHQPDGKNDLLQQIENGALTVVAGYNALGRLYRGIISPTLDQYVMMGDVSNQTDNIPVNSQPGFKTVTEKKMADDRWVFTENNPAREYAIIAYLAGASRSLKGFNDTLSSSCLEISKALWREKREVKNAYVRNNQIHAATELLLTTGEDEFKQFLLKNADSISNHIAQTGWIIGRVIKQLDDKKFSNKINTAVKNYAAKIKELGKETPYGIPYRPYIWGAGWMIQDFGVEQYFLHKAFPEVFTEQYMLNALNFILGCHPGENTASFASGVGAKSTTVAYGYNRADYSFIPGGVVSGTALIRPDFPELKEFPYLWQQTEYVLGGGSSNFMFLVLAAKEILK